MLVAHRQLTPVKVGLIDRVDRVWGLFSFLHPFEARLVYVEKKLVEE